MKLKVLNIAFILLLFPAFGQELKMVLEKDKIFIGEPFLLTLSVENDQPLDKVEYHLRTDFFPAKYSLSLTTDSETYEIEILSVNKDTSFLEGDKYKWEMSYILTAWDSAFVVLPPEPISLNGELFHFPPQMLEVERPKAIPNQSIYDINEHFTDNSSASFSAFVKKNWWWLGLVAGLLSVILIFVFKKKAIAVQSLSIREQALLDIDKLEQGKGYENDLKEYYFELSIILRRFIGQHYEQAILEKTTSQIERILRNEKLSSELIALIMNLLAKSDMVKFAQSKPSVFEIHGVTDEARRVVREIPAIKEDNE